MFVILYHVTIIITAFIQGSTISAVKGRPVKPEKPPLVKGAAACAAASAAAVQAKKKRG